MIIKIYKETYDNNKNYSHRIEIECTSLIIKIELFLQLF